MKTMKSSLYTAKMFVLAAAMLLSCKDDEQKAAPEPMGSLISYTTISSTKFDRIDITVNGEVKAVLNGPSFLKPACGTPASKSVSNVALPAGTHMIGAKQYKDGKVVGSWSEAPTKIPAGDCKKIAWGE
ncbi:hypothetical protein [Dyadobacter sp. 676]|uniref:Uncharacterized protein n=1 Tax=Dyadobacter sp. 676 TaxID=3088362 RepID=A0AAU8FIT3_9BACT